ncbi:MAG: hypothetical protein ABIG44_13120 [Planctomycetota bacterium]
MTRWRARVTHSLPFVLAVALGLGWSISIYRAGIRFSRDSTVFMSSAIDMHVNNIFAVPANRAPLYITLICAALRVEPIPGEAATLISGICLTAVLLTFVLILRRFTRDTPLISLLVLVAVVGVACLFLCLRRRDPDMRRLHLLSTVYVVLAAATLEPYVVYRCTLRDVR